MSLKNKVEMIQRGYALLTGVEVNKNKDMSEMNRIHTEMTQTFAATQLNLQTIG